MGVGLLEGKALSLQDISIISMRGLKQELFDIPMLRLRLEQQSNYSFPIIILIRLILLQMYIDQNFLALLTLRLQSKIYLLLSLLRASPCYLYL
jgi:hypothetical protein